MDALRSLLKPKPALVTPQPKTSFSSYEMRANDPADLYNAQSALQSDTSDRMFQAERLGQIDELKALKGLFQRRQDEMRQGTVEQQRPLTQAVEAGNLDAILGGFGGVNPQAEQARYGRGIAEEKMRIPVEQQRVAGQYDVRQAQTSARGQVDVSRQQGENALNQQDLIGEQAREYREYMYPNGPQTGGAVPGYSPKTGAMGGTAAPRQPNLGSQLNPFAVSRRNLNGLDPWDDANVSNPGVQEFRQRWAGIINGMPTRGVDETGRTSKQDVQDILRNPQLRNLQVSELYDVATTDQQFLSEVQQLLDIARGMK